MNLLSRLLPNLVYTLMGQPRPMPQKAGQTISFRSFSSLPAATTALTEGVTPDGRNLTASEITATPAQYGDYVTLSDILDMTAPDPVLVETGELLGEQAANTIDLIVRDVIAQGTTVQYAAGRAGTSTVAATDLINATEVKKAVRTLHNNKVKHVTQILDASTGVGTKPVAAGYVGIVGASTLYDLKGDSKFTAVHEYGSRTVLLPNEVGALDEVRFVLSHNPKVKTGAGAASIDVHCTLIMGGNAFGVISPAGVQNVIKGFGAGEDPLNQRMTSGWKAFFTAKILQQLAILRLEHAVSA
jgi:N4-gp56 family major capsid protein